MSEYEPEPDVVAAFKRRRRRQLALLVPVLLAFVCIVALAQIEGDTIFGLPTVLIFAICLVVIVVGVIFSFFNWRCPACNSYLGRSLSPKFCWNCGVPLTETQDSGYESEQHGNQ